MILINNTKIDTETMLTNLGLRDCFEEAEDVTDITVESILALRDLIDAKVNQNEFALNQSVDMLSTGKY